MIFFDIYEVLKFHFSRSQGVSAAHPYRAYTYLNGVPCPPRVSISYICRCPKLSLSSVKWKLQQVWHDIVFVEPVDEASIIAPFAILWRFVIYNTAKNCRGRLRAEFWGLFLDTISVSSACVATCKCEAKETIVLWSVGLHVQPGSPATESLHFSLMFADCMLTTYSAVMW